MGIQNENRRAAMAMSRSVALETLEGRTFLSSVASEHPVPSGGGPHVGAHTVMPPVQLGRFVALRESGESAARVEQHDRRESSEHEHEDGTKRSHRRTGENAEESAPIPMYTTMSLGVPGFVVQVVVELPLPRQTASPPMNPPRPAPSPAAAPKESGPPESAGVTTPVVGSPPAHLIARPPKPAASDAASLVSQVQSEAPVARHREIEPDRTAALATHIASGALTVIAQARAVAMQAGSVVTHSAMAAVDATAKAIPAVAPVESSHRIFQIAAMGTRCGLLSDAVAELADEFAALAPLDGPVAQTHRAWTITAMVAVADLVWLAYLYRVNAKRRKTGSVAAA